MSALTTPAARSAVTQFLAQGHDQRWPSPAGRRGPERAVWPWPGGEREVYVRIVPARITGRRIKAQ
jgi:hypothetical protein